MRRLVLVGLLACVAVPAGALAARAIPGDGTLAVRNGSGYLSLTLRDGVVIGKLESGVLEVFSETITDCTDLNVWGADRGPAEVTRERIDGTTVTRCIFREFALSGTPEATRFRLVLKDATLVLRRGSTGFSLSAIGRGRGFVEGAGGQDGLFSLDGDPFVSLPDAGRRFVLGATLP